MKIADVSRFNWDPEVNPVTRPGSSSPDDFTSVMKKAIREVNRQQSAADQKIRAQIINGSEDLHEVMLALEKAGLGFKLLIQVRNKLIQAYEEINRMPL